MGFHRGKDPAGSVHPVRGTGQPGPRFNYELFNHNNFNIRYWSWNYRGCWPLLQRSETAGISPVGAPSPLQLSPTGIGPVVLIACVAGAPDQKPAFAGAGTYLKPPASAVRPTPLRALQGLPKNRFSGAPLGISIGHEAP